VSAKTAGRYDIQMRTNETFSMQLVYKDRNKLPIDITGYTAHMQVRNKPGGNVLILDSNNVGNSITVDGPNGVVNVEFGVDNMLGVTAQKGAYDLALIDPADKPAVVVEGTVAIIKGVTR